MLKFEKYQGAGNDFVIVSEKELIEKGIPEYGEFASQVCNRHFGIGADGLIILKYVASMPFMFFFNADGSQAPMCGNGIRCFSHYLVNNHLVDGNEFVVKTVPGDLTIRVNYDEEKDDFSARVNMGKPIFNIKELINTEKEQFLREKINIDGKEIEISYIFMGTDHSVIFVNDFSDYDIDEIGKKIENYTDLFPKKVNVNFVKVYDRKRIEVITWERGAGRTLACGTGATASAVLARTFGFVDNKVNVKVPGGQLVIEYEGGENNAFMTGPSEKIAEGLYKFQR
ncbi:Diaminopimelate epimerase [uncultured Leptotrichia sp.]|jgi:diaminopimelate epimerase|uniref:diaminopimelate epimerase n=1 Tax=uncultured Leptotrichia sp. TaxID=159271 RepID=UPI001A42D217|nr:diaminopimelate epimerase [uncultured Leptotrichia sp.]VTX65372.1 Diaminopimelate epimerase [uncultured Leptotrichia sp.]